MTQEPTKANNTEDFDCSSTVHVSSTGHSEQLFQDRSGNVTSKQTIDLDQDAEFAILQERFKLQMKVDEHRQSLSSQGEQKEFDALLSGGAIQCNVYLHIDFNEKVAGVDAINDPQYAAQKALVLENTSSGLRDDGVDIDGNTAVIAGAQENTDLSDVDKLIVKTNAYAPF